MRFVVVGAFTFCMMSLSTFARDFSPRTTKAFDHRTEYPSSSISGAVREAISSSKLWQHFSAKFSREHPEGILPSSFYMMMRDGVWLFTTVWTIDSSPRPTVFISSHPDSRF